MDTENKVEATKTSDTDNSVAPLQDPVQVELNKEQEKQTRTEKDKVTFNLRKKADEARKLGIDPKEILGLDGEETEDSSEVPEWYKKEKARETTKTALQLADTLPDQAQRDLVKQYLNTRIIPSGDAESDFRFALANVSALKNKQIIDEVQRYTPARTTASGGSASARVEEEFTPTQEEAVMMARPYNLSREKILEARKKEQARA